MNDLQRNRRFAAIQDAGCIIARKLGLGFVPCEIHHLLTTGRHGNGRRRGDAATVGLNTWSHRGEPFGGLSASQCRQKFGPSYAREPRAFREHFGSDDELLEYQDAIVRGTYL